MHVPEHVTHHRVKFGDETTSRPPCAKMYVHDFFRNFLTSFKFSIFFEKTGSTCSRVHFVVSVSEIEFGSRYVQKY